MNEKKLEYTHVTIGPQCHKDLQKLSSREARSMASEIKFLVGLRTRMLDAEEKMRYTLTPTFDGQQLQQQQRSTTKTTPIEREIVA
jgi:hypothetical protein